MTEEQLKRGIHLQGRIDHAEQFMEKLRTMDRETYSVGIEIRFLSDQEKALTNAFEPGEVEAWATTRLLERVAEFRRELATL